LFKRLSENLAGVEKELACMSEEKQMLTNHVSDAQRQVNELENSRRALEARAAAHRDRNARLSQQLSEAESKASEQLMVAMTLEATNIEHARVLQAKLSASNVLKETISDEVDELEKKVGETEEMLKHVLQITAQVSRINAQNNRSMKPAPSDSTHQPDPHYSMKTTSSAKLVRPKPKVHPCLHVP
jgi:predicted  nucleic acid-binding Zn-ribbon protein